MSPAAAVLEDGSLRGAVTTHEGSLLRAPLRRRPRASGDTDSNAAILGAWLGALHGERGLTRSLVSRLHDADWFSSRRRPTFAGPRHLRALAERLTGARRGETTLDAEFNSAGALIRNLMLSPRVLACAFETALRK